MRKRFLVLLALSFATLPGAVKAASPDECNAYADAAMPQVQQNASTPITVVLNWDASLKK